jgi:hypothetical protein
MDLIWEQVVVDADEPVKLGYWWAEGKEFCVLSSRP